MLNKTCTRTAKSAPYPPCTVTVFWLKNTGRGRCLRLVTQPPHIAGPLVVIAQTICALNHTMITSIYLDSFVTTDCSLTQIIVNRICNTYRLAPKSTSPHAQPFASLSFCPPDRSCMAQLTSNTDNKVKKLVMFFAGASLNSRVETAGG